MYPLLVPFVWLFIWTVIVGVNVIDRCAIYQNTIINKTSTWPFWASSTIVGLMIILAYNTAVVLFEGIAHRAIIQTIPAGAISLFLIITVWLSLTGMVRQFKARFV